MSTLIFLLDKALVNFEESSYWRRRAYEALGNLDSATSDYQAAVNLQLNFTPAIEALSGE